MLCWSYGTATERVSEVVAHGNVRGASLAIGGNMNQGM